MTKAENEMMMMNYKKKDGDKLSLPVDKVGITKNVTKDVFAKLEFNQPKDFHY